MPLARHEDVLPLLRAPSGSSVLINQRLFSDAASNGTIPVLLDFEKSVVDAPEAGQIIASQIDRQNFSGLARWIKKVLSPTSDITLRNVEYLATLLRTQIKKPKVLVIGGGSVGKGMHVLYNDPNIQIVAFDIYQTGNIHFVADAHDIPLKDECVHGVVVQAVLEHVIDPGKVVSEIHRVLKFGGFVYAETPFMQQVHEGPYDFTRFTESGHRHLFKSFDLLESGSNGGPGTQFMWSVEHLIRGLFRSKTAGRLAKLCVFWAQYLDHLIPENYSIDGASGVYFLGKKSSSSLSPKDTVKHYKGAQTFSATVSRRTAFFQPSAPTPDPTNFPNAQTYNRHCQVVCQRLQRAVAGAVRRSTLGHSHSKDRARPIGRGGRKWKRSDSGGV
ncbi:MAG: class I SAM-dependent methyltransferase [Pseudomonadota bacterium]